MGFGELQFDYVRFPDEPETRMAHAVFPGRKDNETTRAAWPGTSACSGIG